MGIFFNFFFIGNIFLVATTNSNSRGNVNVTGYHLK